MVGFFPGTIKAKLSTFGRVFGFINALGLK